MSFHTNGADRHEQLEKLPPRERAHTISIARHNLQSAKIAQAELRYGKVQHILKDSPYAKLWKKEVAKPLDISRYSNPVLQETVQQNMLEEELTTDPFLFDAMASGDADPVEAELQQIITEEQAKVAETKAESEQVRKVRALAKTGLDTAKTIEESNGHITEVASKY